MLDTTQLIETPEGVELELRVAGPVVRATAWIIDTIIRSILYVGLGYILFPFGALGKGIFYIGVFVIEWFYPVMFEVLQQGATPGKKWMKLRVLHDLGTPVGWTASMIRNLLRVIDFLPFAYGFGLFSMLATKEFKRLGDLAAGTIVVYQNQAIKYVALPEVSPLPLAITLPLAQQRAIISFAERAKTLSTERAIELANIVTALTGNTGAPAVSTLYQIAHGLLGKNSVGKIRIKN